MILGLMSSNEILIKNINYYVSKDITQIVCGCETLIDNEVIRYANSNNIELKVFPLDKTMSEIQAHNLRNESISDYANEFTIFWDGKDNYTKDLIDMCKLKGKKVFVVQVILPLGSENITLYSDDIADIPLFLEFLEKVCTDVI